MVAAWRKNNRERHNANARRWRSDNPDKARQINREQYEKNKDDRYARGRKWAIENRDKCRAAGKRWRAKPSSKQIRRDNSKRRRENHPEKTSAAEKKWRQKNPALIRAYAKTRRARKLNAPINDFTAAQWAALQIAFDYRCAYCDKRRKGKLTQDHVVALSKGGAHTASNIVPACASCNSKKHTGPPLRPVQIPLIT